ncbi:hypothetical protein HPB50_019100 [Hyalomma asiaticum]|uniref:Uncharacterized protein n=1 Tax=Hyalomma asiaticum TaxID=266040 RepID=A0ACB7SRI5_HYAAI|nr:hypothetical protein HPB50_019100 [Hyalomma asiaticum]
MALRGSAPLNFAIHAAIDNAAIYVARNPTHTELASSRKEDRVYREARLYEPVREEGSCLQGRPSSDFTSRPRTEHGRLKPRPCPSFPFERGPPAFFSQVHSRSDLFFTPAKVGRRRKGLTQKKKSGGPFPPPPIASTAANFRQHGKAKKKKEGRLLPFRGKRAQKLGKMRLDLDKGPGSRKEQRVAPGR